MKPGMRLTLRAATALAMAAALACSEQPEGGERASSGERAGGGDLPAMLERGTIRVGVAEFVPWTLKNAAGELIGHEIDVAKKIARDMGVEPEFKVYVWENIIPALQKGEIDVIAGGMAITPERALKVNFSRPLAQTGVGLATNTRMTVEVDSLKQLNSPQYVISTVKDTFAAGVSGMLFGSAKVRYFETREAAEKEVLEGRAHVYLASLPEVQFLLGERKIHS